MIIKHARVGDEARKNVEKKKNPRWRSRADNADVDALMIERGSLAK